MSLSGSKADTKTDAKADVEKRKFFFNIMRGTGIGAIGGLIWGGYLNEARSASLIIRPPGAVLNEADFLSLCIRCGQCVEACNNRENKPSEADVTLRLAKAGDNNPIGTPFFTPRQTPCYMCPDIPCVSSCPTGALEPELVLNEGKLQSLQANDGEVEPEEAFDINKSRMGLAVVNKETCIAYWGIQCDACYRACPLIDKAITLELARNKRTGKHAFLLPIVSSEHCTGCGICEHVCVTKKAAIRVLPIKVAMGEVSSHYTKGWEAEDEKRIHLTPKEDNRIKTRRNTQRALDYLNKGIE